jgi:hypothetical protein
MRYTILAVFVASLFSCKKNNDSEIIYATWPMTKVEGSNTGSINQSIPLTVYWPYASGSCDILDKFEEVREGNIIYVKALGHSASGICTTDAGIKTKTYNFFSTKAGTFELRFVNKDNSFILHTVTIN